jgi:hypothetical protein
MCKRLWVSLWGILAVGLLAGCGSTGSSGGGTQYLEVSAGRGRAPGGGNSAAEKLRATQIAAEPRGGYYVGRRYHIEGTRFWGYVRKPGQPWQQARLIVLNEDSKLAPDRLPERPVGVTERFSFDHNYEYKLWGSFTGGTVYDPNANLFLPEFRLSNFELISASPGWLFKPGETYSTGRLPWVPGR